MGDFFDKIVVLRFFEFVFVFYFVREFMVKMCCCKGMFEDVIVSKFFDDDLFIEFV